MNFIFQRLREPSSWASLAAILASVGVTLPQELVGYAVQGLAGIFGAIGFFVAERGRR